MMASLEVLLKDRDHLSSQTWYNLQDRSKKMKRMKNSHTYLMNVSSILVDGGFGLSKHFLMLELDGFISQLQEAN